MSLNCTMYYYGFQIAFIGVIMSNCHVDIYNDYLKCNISYVLTPTVHDMFDGVEPQPRPCLLSNGCVGACLESILDHQQHVRALYIVHQVILFVEVRLPYHRGCTLSTAYVVNSRLYPSEVAT